MTTDPDSADGGQPADEKLFGADPGKLREVKVHELLIRFAFGAAISAVAGIVSLAVNPVAGGMFLAFPAILPATLTLIEQKEGTDQARMDAQGAVAGGLALALFAVRRLRTATDWCRCRAVGRIAGVAGDSRCSVSPGRNGAAPPPRTITRCCRGPTSIGWSAGRSVLSFGSCRSAASCPCTTAGAGPSCSPAPATLKYLVGRPSQARSGDADGFCKNRCVGTRVVVLPDPPAVGERCVAVHVDRGATTAGEATTAKDV